MLRTKNTLCCLMLAALLSGCSMELPVIGNVQDKVLPLLDTLENTLTPLKGVIGPLRERFFPQEEAEKQQTPTGPRRRRHAAAANPAENNEDEDQPQATPAPVQQDPRQKRIETNMAFDHWRSEGIRKIYEGETLEAIECFKKALALRPNDPNIQDWLFLVENRSSGKKNSNALPDPGPMEGPAETPNAPALPAGPNLF